MDTGIKSYVNQYIKLYKDILIQKYIPQLISASKYTSIN